MLRPFLLALPLLTLANVATASDRVAIRPNVDPATLHREVRVNVNVNFFVPVALDDPDASVKAQEQARRRLYESASKECDLLLAVIASHCRLEGINVNVHMNRSYNQQAQGFNASGRFSYRVTLK